MNRTVLVGRITKPVELRSTTAGKSIVRFSLAVPRRKRDDGADFVNCVAFDKVAELMAQYVHKGDRIGISGRIQTGSYERNGSKIYTTDVIADEIEFMEQRKEEETFTPIVEDQDLPF